MHLKVEFNSNEMKRFLLAQNELAAEKSISEIHALNQSLEIFNSIK